MASIIHDITHFRGEEERQSRPCVDTGRPRGEASRAKRFDHHRRLGHSSERWDHRQPARFAGSARTCLAWRRCATRFHPATNENTVIVSALRPKSIRGMKTEVRKAHYVLVRRIHRRPALQKVQASGRVPGSSAQVKHGVFRRGMYRVHGRSEFHELSHNFTAAAALFHVTGDARKESGTMFILSRAE